jgi:DNA-binding NtrC family response regulator
MNDEAHFITPDPRRQDTPLSPKPALKIVVVDDEPMLVELYRNYLKALFPDARIISFLNGNAAWAYLEQESPELLISDLKHCGMGGFEMLSRLSQKGVTYPIVIVSGYLEEGIRQVCHYAGPRLNVHYLPKPFELKKFVSLVQQCLARPHPVDNLAQPVGAPIRPLKVVHLDDEEVFLHLIAALLKRRFSHIQLFQFQNSPSAWRILTEASPDLLITDDIMSGNREWNGENIVRQLVARRVEYPIMVMSGWPPTQTWVHRVGAGHRKFAFLSNPFSLAEFYRELDRLIGQPLQKG